MANLHFDPIRERDVDFVIMREFHTNRRFADLFIKQVGICNCEILRIEHSVMNAELGESDIEVTLATDNGKVALLIENKINAEQQPMQYERYIMRGDKKIEDGEVERYYMNMRSCIIQTSTN